MFAIGIFLGAFLLFHIQPLVAKHILPWYGSTPAVWTTCMLFFQTLLVGGYAYAHLLTRRRSAARQTAIHACILLAAAGLQLLQWRGWGAPLLPGDAWKVYPPDEPRRWLLLMLLAGVGLPYFVLATTNPLLQKWFTRARPGSSPYGLYVLSNLGSLAGLLAYPLVVERLMPLRMQAVMVASLFLVYAAICIACARLASRGPDTAGAAEPAGTPAPGPLVARRFLPACWLALAFTGSVMLLAVTNQLCQEVAVVPLLWVVPLALYLVSFMIGFSSGPFYSRRFFVGLFVLASFATCVALVSPHAFRLPGQIAIYSGLLLGACTFCHGELARLKPSADKLTGYYLIISVGGALGGLFVGLLAPQIFSAFLEFHLGLLLCWLLLLALLLGDRQSALYAGSRPLAVTVIVCGLLAGAWLVQPVLMRGARLTAGQYAVPYYYSVAGLVALLTAAFVLRRPASSRLHAGRRGWPVAGLAVSFIVVSVAAVHSIGEYRRNAVSFSRNFFGAMRLRETPISTRTGTVYRVLINGTILHGMQAVEPDLARRTTAYYTERSGAGIALLNHPRRTNGLPLRVGVVGLGAGTLAAYNRTNDFVRFYEINPAVAELSRGDRPSFTYLRDAPGEAQIALGDGRILLERELGAGRPGDFDVLVLDAFSSDAIPVHLLTRQAFELYLAHLRKPDGIIAVNFANRFVDLLPVLRAHARTFGLELSIIVLNGDNQRAMVSSWALFCANPAVLASSAFTSVDDKSKLAGRRIEWTDDFSNIFDLLR